MPSPTSSSSRSRAARALPLLLLSLLPIALAAQSDALPVYDVGTLVRLHHIVDSLHALFATMPPGPPLASREQTIGSFIRLIGDSATIAEAARMMERGASFEEITASFPRQVVVARREVVVTRGTIRGDDFVDRPALVAWVKPRDPGTTSIIDTLRKEKAAAPRRWLWRIEWGFGGWHEGMTADDIDMAEPAEIDAVLARDELTRTVIPPSYARMIDYLAFMADTATTLLIPWGPMTGPVRDDYERLIDSLEEMAGPMFPTPLDRGDTQTVEQWRELWEEWWTGYYARYTAKTGDTTFLEALVRTAEAAIREHNEDGYLDEIIERCLPNERGLDLLRRLPHPYGCQLGKHHYDLANGLVSIAARIPRWPIFLRAELAMLYGDAPVTRSPLHDPIRELEATGVDMPMIGMGMTLHIDDRNPVHPRMMAGPTASFMAGLTSRDAFESRLLTAMKDPSLDPLDRWTAYDIYMQYIMRLRSPVLRGALVEDLRSCADELPGYIREHLASLTDENPTPLFR